jgi:hypothetical protein
MEKIFEYATRNKVRFLFKGQASVEDLWDLSLNDLDTIYKQLNSQVKQAQEESLLNKKTNENKRLEVKIDIVKYIVKTKLEEAEARNKERENKEQKQKLMEILANKKEESLQNKSVEELEEMLKNLDK